MKKFAWGIIILHTCNKNHDHMMYSSWDNRVRQIFFVILSHFLPFFLPLMILNIKIFKKMKKCLEISFYTYMCTINEGHTIYGSWNIRCNRQKFLTFWAIFCPFSPLFCLFIFHFLGHKYRFNIKTYDICHMK